ncbi:hypothetical protein N234_16360 [Ralstonia pickettii DTP0602]|nr:hypothetical protein N234_16360 [Ralstonia pickettii DTP0602]
MDVCGFALAAIINMRFNPTMRLALPTTSLIETGGHGDVQVPCAHAFRVQQHRHLRF